MNKQLKIWRDDFIRYYNKTSFMMRIVIGALISFAIAWVAINRVIKPQNETLVAVVKKYQAMEVIDDVNITVADLKNSQRKAKMQLDSIAELNDILAENMGNMTKADTSKNMIDLRTLIEHNELKIISESPVKVVAVTKKRSYRSRQAQVIDTRVKVVLPESMGYDSFNFKVLGTYPQIKKFLMDIQVASSVFFINNIKIEKTNEIITDRDFKQFNALSLSFEAHTPYKKDK